MPALRCQLFAAIWLLIGAAPSIQAQVPGYFQFRTQEGLPSTNIYEIEVDQNGVLWLATEFGLTSYDGIEFRTYGRKEGFLDTDVIDIVMDRRGWLWAKVFGKGLGIFYRDHYYPLPSFHPNISNELLWPFRDDAGRMGMVFRGSVWEFLDLESHPFRWSPNTEMGWRGKAGKWHQMNRGAHTVGQLKYPSERFFYYNAFVKEGALYGVEQEGIWKVSDEKPEWVHTFAEPLWECHELLVTSNMILLGYSDGLRVLRPQPAGGFALQHYFPQFNVQSIELDHEGALWLGTQQNGLIQIPNLDMIRYQFPGSHQFYECEADADGILYAAGSKNQILVVTENETELKAYPRKGRGKVQTMRRNRKGGVTTVFDHLLVGSPNFPLENHFFSSLKDVIITPGDTFFISDRKYGLYRIYGPEFRRLLLKENGFQSSGLRIDLLPSCEYLRPWAQCLHYDDSTATLWGSFENQVFSYRQGQIEVLGALPEGLWVQELVADPGRPPLVSTSHAGLFVWEGGKFIRWEIDFEGEMPTIQRVVRENETRTWLACREGIVLVSGAPGAPDSRVDHFGQETRFPFRVVNDLWIGDQHIWAATDEGLFQFPRRFLTDAVPPPKILLDSVLVEGETLADSGEVDAQAVLVAKFRGISYQVPAIEYRYSLIGPAPQSGRIRERELILHGLPAGTYTLVLQAISGTGIHSQPTRFTFTVVTPYWQRWWFLALVALGGLLGMAGLVGVTNAVRRGAEKRKEQIHELERRALRAQINPHFLYNALNSIHVYIGNHEERKAHVFLSKFAKLTRIVLNASGESMISLGTELSAIQHYLELERMRMEEKFDFEIHVDLPWPAETLAVPSLLVQPFLENAVLHGVRHLRDRKGEIRVRVTGNGHLCITIEDNGIGRTAAARLRKDRPAHHRSQGSRITIERIGLIKGAKYTIQDLTDATGTPRGTRCQIFLPWNHMS